MTKAIYPNIGPIRSRDVLYVTLVGSALGMAFTVALIAAWIIYLVTAKGLSPADIDRTINLFTTGFAANMAMIVVFYVPCLWVMWRVARRFSERPLAGFFPRIKPMTALGALAAGVALTVLWLAVEKVLSAKFGMDFTATGTEKAMMPTSPGQFVVCVLVISAVGPLVEEFFFRGYLLAWLRQSMATPFAVTLSALAFALVHGFMVLHPGIVGWISTGEIFVAGLVLGFAVVRTGSLWTAYLMHAAYNAATAAHALFWPL